MQASWRSTVVVAVLSAGLAGAAPAADSAAPQENGAERGAGKARWTETLSAGDAPGEFVHSRSGLRYEPSAVMRRPEGVSRLTGLTTFPARTLEQPVDTFRPVVTATAAPGTSVEVDVRVRAPSGAWSEWRTAAPGEAVHLPASGTEVQVRLALVADEHGRGPEVQSLEVEGWQEGVASREALQTLVPLTYRIYATREGLVGSQTANGHIIKSYDRFVALPSRRGLASNGGSEYQVRVCYAKTSKCATASVWDIGPWNTTDDYWNPSSIRQSWKSLPQGKPEAQAAYQDNFNGGLDEFGRRPANPAGIDLADGTFWTDLGMTDNDWVDVTYLWTTSSSGALVIDNNNANNDTTKGYIETAGTSWVTSVNVSGYYGNNYLVSPTQSVSEPITFWFYLPAAATKTVDAWWTAATDRATAAPFIVWSANGTQLANVKVNQQLNGAKWNTLGTWSFAAGWNKVQLSRWTTAGAYVVADAIQVR
ncbi:hypothetical protein JGU66_08585 [Myxococcaceae bacterium JPH2]|nr:hypothetical protein [Myxococcaceae bacterium JPH2]